MYHSSLLLPYSIHLSMNTLVCFSWTMLGMIISWTWTLWQEVTQDRLLFFSAGNLFCCFSGPHLTDFFSKLNLVYVLINSNVTWADLFLIDGVFQYLCTALSPNSTRIQVIYFCFLKDSAVVENEFKARSFYRPFSCTCGYLLPAMLTCSHILCCNPPHQEDEQDPSLSCWLLYSIYKAPKFLSKRLS